VGVVVVARGKALAVCENTQRVGHGDGSILTAFTTRRSDKCADIGVADRREGE
jgi:hypothetical protein